MMSDEIKWSNARNKVEAISSHLSDCRRVLDFGCGDLSMASLLVDKNPKLRVTGIDVVNFGTRDKRITFQTYNGRRIPFPDNAFDAVISYHVFHHTTDPEEYFRECVRVAKRKVLFVEPVYRWIGEYPGMVFMDWLFNVWKKEHIPMTYSFKSKAWWLTRIREERLTVIDIRDVEILPSVFPTGRSLLFTTKKI